MMLIYDHIEVSIHAYIRRSWMRFGRWFVAQSVAYAFASPNVAKVAAQVREGLESAVNCGLKLGFVREGFLRDAVQRDGRLYGVHLLAITRRDYGRIQENR